MHFMCMCSFMFLFYYEYTCCRYDFFLNNSGSFLLNSFDLVTLQVMLLSFCCLLLSPSSRFQNLVCMNLTITIRQDLASEAGYMRAKHARALANNDTMYLSKKEMEALSIARLAVDEGNLIISECSDNSAYEHFFFLSINKRYLLFSLSLN